MNNNLSALFQLINPDNSISINRYLAHAIGLNEALIFAALISKYTYYSNKNTLDQEGFFYSTIDDLEESTTLGRKAQDRAIKKLVQLKLIETKLKGLPAKRHFKINPDISILESLINNVKTSMSKRDKLDNKAENDGQTNTSDMDKTDCPKGTNLDVQKGQENYSNKTIDNKTNKSINLPYEEVEKHFKRQIDYDRLIEDNNINPQELNNVVDIAIDVLTSTADSVRVNGENKPTEIVKSQYNKLNMIHIINILNRLDNYSKKATNIRGLIITSLYNEAMTQDIYYKNLFNNDFLN
jgi:hypothetical protein